MNTGRPILAQLGLVLVPMPVQVVFGGIWLMLMVLGFAWQDHIDQHHLHMVTFTDRLIMVQLGQVLEIRVGSAVGTL